MIRRAFRRTPPRRSGLAVGLLAILFVPGCMVQQSQQGEAHVYTASLLASLLLIAIALVIGGFGVAFVFLGVRPERSQHRSSSSQKAFAVIGGSGAILVALAILVIGVPYSFLTHITIKQDRVVMRDSVLWFANGDREIPFDSVASFQREDAPIARKGREKEYLIIRYRDGGSERIEMGPRERAAFDKLTERHAAYFADLGSDVAAGLTAAPRSTGEVIRYYALCGIPDTHATARDLDLKTGDTGIICFDKQWRNVVLVDDAKDRSAKVTWDDFPGRTTMVSTIDLYVTDSVKQARMSDAQRRNEAFLASQLPAAQRNDAAADSLGQPTGGVPGVSDARIPGGKNAGRVDADLAIKRYPIKIALPPGAATVTPETSLVPGIKLRACYAGKWDTVTVVGLYPNGDVYCTWDNFGDWPRRMIREDLIIATTALADSRDSPEQQGPVEVKPVEREWTDRSGDFKVTATYVDSKQDYVRLRKPNGEEISVPISRMSLRDQEMIKQLSSTAK